MRDTVRKCLAMLPTRLRRRWLLLVPLAVVTGLAEIGAAAAIFVLMLVLTDPARAFAEPWVRQLLQYLPTRTTESIILQLTGLIGGYYVLKGLLLLGGQFLRHRISHDSRSYLGSEMLRRYLSAPYPFHFRRNSAELIRNCTSSVGDVLGGVLGAAVGIAGDLLMSAGLIVVLVTTSPGISIVAGVTLIAMMAILMKTTHRAVARLGGNSHELAASMLKGLQQAFGGIKEVKVLGREQFFYDEFLERQRQLLMLGFLGITLGSLPSLVLQTVLLCGALALIAVLIGLGQTGIAAVPVAAVFGYAGLRILPMATSVVSALNGIRARRQAVDDLHDDFVALGASWATSPPPRNVALQHEIRLERVSYTYPGSPTPALSDVSLVIRRGESIGIVGPTGAGKSTLVDLILGLLPPSSGRITVDGVDISRVTWRRRVGYVPSSVFLIDDTVRRNVALGVRDDAIDDDRIRTVIGMAQLLPFVDGLPDGLDTLVGERGVRLSGGERQRVAIARALYHDPDLVVFDEATSALDVTTEAEVTRAVDGLRRFKTMIVVAHRLSTVKRTDRLVWIRAGRIAAVGSFEDLQCRDEEFRALAALAAV